MGHSSSAGFWIPKKPIEIKPQPRAAHSSRKRKSSGAGFGRGRPSGASRGRPAKAVVQEMVEEAADSDADGEQVIEEVPVSRMPILPLSLQAGIYNEFRCVIQPACAPLVATLSTHLVQPSWQTEASVQTSL